MSAKDDNELFLRPEAMYAKLEAMFSELQGKLEAMHSELEAWDAKLEESLFDIRNEMNVMRAKESGRVAREAGGHFSTTNRTGMTRHPAYGGGMTSAGHSFYENDEQREYRPSTWR